MYVKSFYERWNTCASHSTRSERNDKPTKDEQKEYVLFKWRSGDS